MFSKENWQIFWLLRDPLADYFGHCCRAIRFSRIRNSQRVRFFITHNLATVSFYKEGNSNRRLKVLALIIAGNNRKDDLE